MASIEQETEPLVQRQEVRYLLEEDCGSRILKLLEDNGFSLDDHQNPITQTIYFASPSLITVSGGYIRIRRYIPEGRASRDTISLSPKDEWFLEVKLPTGEKERIQRSYGEIENLLDPVSRQILAEQFPAGTMLLQGFEDRLIPIVATQWFRRHFSSVRYRSRVTMDSGVSYYRFLPGEPRGVLMSSRNGLRLEIKTPVGFENELPTIQKILSVSQAEPLPVNWHEDLLRKLYSEFLMRKLGLCLKVAT